MRRHILLAAFAACLPVPASCQQVSAPPPLPAVFAGGVRTVADLPYRRIEGETLALDLYLPPPGNDRHPAIVFVHGGGFVTGHTRMMGAATDFPARLAALAARGYVVASIQYRLAPRVHFPGQVRDAKAAIAWLRDHAGKYGIDPTRVAIWGSSAGGTIAATVGTTCGIALFEPEDAALPPGKTCVQAVADWFGPIAMDGQVLGATYLGCVTGEPCDERRRSASPATYVKKGAPPFLLLHGDSDKLVPLDQSGQFAGVLRAAGVDTSLEIVAGAEHGLKATDRARQQSILDHAMDTLGSFLDRTIGPSSRRNGRPATGRK
jgi:acetyl esterase/lipase